MTATPVVKDSASVTTAGEFVKKRVTLGGSTDYGSVNAGSCILRGLHVNAAISADIWLSDSTGKQFLIPSTLAKGDERWFGDVEMDKIIVESGSATGDFTLEYKAFN